MKKILKKIKKNYAGFDGNTLNTLSLYRAVLGPEFDTFLNSPDNWYSQSFYDLVRGIEEDIQNSLPNYEEYLRSGQLEDFLAYAKQASGSTDYTTNILPAINTLKAEYKSEVAKDFSFVWNPSKVFYDKIKVTVPTPPNVIAKQEYDKFVLVSNDNLEYLKDVAQNVRFNHGNAVYDQYMLLVAARQADYDKLMKDAIVLSQNAPKLEDLFAKYLREIGRLDNLEAWKTAIKQTKQVYGEVYGQALEQMYVKTKNDDLLEEKAKKGLDYIYKQIGNFLDIDKWKAAIAKIDDRQAAEIVQREWAKLYNKALKEKKDKEIIDEPKKPVDKPTKERIDLPIEPEKPVKPTKKKRVPKPNFLNKIFNLFSKK